MMRLRLRMLLAVAAKECAQLARDRLTAALLFGVPLVQVLLFGCAIELAPRHWPSVWVAQPTLAGPAANADLDRILLAQMRARAATDDWLDLAPAPVSEEQAQAALVRGEARLILRWPQQPSHYVLRGEAIPVSVDADVSDPYVAVALAALTQAIAGGVGPAPDGSALRLSVHPRFALARGSGAYLVPALSGVILTLTLTLLAAFALVRERERATWDSLRSTPAGAGVIVLGKLLPYAGLGLMLFGLLQLVAHFIFGSALASGTQWLAACAFMLGQLGLGACLSLLARTQMQAMQLGVFFYLPSILLSGFMFPFHAMPAWARMLGELLPLTHFLRVLRADLFRAADNVTELMLAWPIGLFALTMLTLAILGYRRSIA